MDLNLRSPSFNDALFQLQKLDQQFTSQLTQIQREVRQQYQDLHRNSLGHFFDDAKET